MTSTLDTHRLSSVRLQTIRRFDLRSGPGEPVALLFAYVPGNAGSRGNHAADRQKPRKKAAADDH